VLRTLRLDGLIAAMLTLSAAAATAQIIDFLETPDLSPPSTGTSLDFGSRAIPADFFGPGSDPFTGVIELISDPVNTGLFGHTDTRIERNSDPFDRSDPPGPATVQVDIQIVELSLQSVAPIVVTFNGGQNPEAWNVHTDLQGTQPTGQMTVTKTHANGGVFDATLPIFPLLRFTKDSNPTEQKVLFAPQSFVFNFQDAPWVHDVDPNLGVFVPGGANFVPGVEETVPGDLNSQQRVPSTALSTPNPNLPDGELSVIAPLGTGLPGVSIAGLMTLGLLLMGAAVVLVIRVRRTEHAAAA